VEVVLCLLCAVYLAPFIVAARREHERLGAVLALNLLVGWTGIGWLLALRWARRPPKATEPAVRSRRGHLRLLEPPPSRQDDAAPVPRSPLASFRGSDEIAG